MMPELTTYYLEMTSPDFLNEKNSSELYVQEAEVKQFKLNRFLYQLVGEDWNWTDKLSLSDQQWRDYAENDNLKTWVAYNRGSIAGFYELQSDTDGNVKISYFGLSPKFIGMGFGASLLSHAIKSAWGWQGAKRVWLHTCSSDHQSALSNYKARGFQVYRQTVE